MPIHVTIAINDRPIKNVHIARVSGGAGRARGVVHEYSVLDQQNEPASDKEWMDGTLFTHKYGDGVETLVRRALEALEHKKNGRVPSVE